jgi:hypothetical protein
MKRIVIILALLPLLWNCQNRPSRTELEQQNDSLMVAAADKESQMNDMVNTLGEIEANLRIIKEKEKIIALKAGEGDTRGASADEINKDIRLIYDLMVQNKERIQSLDEQLRKSGIETSRLNRLINGLNEKLREKDMDLMKLSELLKNKDMEIDDMTYAIAGMEITLDSLKTANKETLEALSSTKDDLYTAYYAIGTRSELKEKNIISREGFLFFGRTLVLEEDFDKSYFSRVNILTTDTIPTYQTRVKVLTTHPDGSYLLEKDESGYQQVIIKNKDLFWSVSRYLVLQVS